MSTAVAALPGPSEPWPDPPRLELRGGERSAAEVHDVAQRLRIAPMAARLLLARGVTDEAQQRRVLDPRLADLRRPDAMAGFPAALELLEAACRRGQRVGVFGDYDVDGVTTTTILTTFLEALGVQVVARVAHRSRGYGLGVADAAAFAEAKVGLVLTGDCGTSDEEALQWLRDRGLHTVVIDHHQVPERMPPTDALINPHQPDCAFPFKGMCSAGVAFYLCAALRTRLAQRGHPSLPDPRAWLDLVALATVCDMMPLREENRVLVTHGLRHMSQGPLRPGLGALLSAAGVERGPIDETHLGFRLGPRINAPGRLGAAEPSLRLLRARSEAEAMPLAEQIETLNARRKRHQQETVVQALTLLAADPRASERAALVIAHDGWLPGVVGIAAAGVVEHHRRPALVLAIDREAGLARGSVRSFGTVDVRAALAACSELLVRFGGHREAAGATVRVDRIEALTEAFDDAVARQREEQAARAGASESAEVVDAVLPLEALDPSLIGAMRTLAPYGMGFEPPSFGCDDAVVETVRVLKDKHLALTLRQGAARCEAIAFGQAQAPSLRGLSRGDRVGCIYVPQIDTFRGQSRLRMHIEHLWGVHAPRGR
ncbi:single-stranded-DNA-specific exonuclease RecJ [Paraliomyxa miuraensis]|uniref:single-stranded-DNA-specific exonuclease RecJ n=1 Tax=Paraliomyxa miuraensis TaxID=376150 RepID=UPI002258132B|nr:single-stranded-DNA-specific exonuclease RecJ [Paraliomyxa miuraensis]MCX4244637.1 single-stranded-DNA-specific exonuclease RecJ [Paraliomyxa miuraensis]